MITTRQLKGYQVLEERYIDEMESDGVLLEHIQSGAKVVMLSNNDDNKVFTIGFRTPPPDDTGVAHILEHSVLCGSKKFPAKDTFVELAKGSLHTFLNAFTFPDKTIYPIASRNDQDFQNLMDVYLDAVLNPNVYQKEEIFLQEGWHHVLESTDADLYYNGVVYNEMKGAFSNPDSIMRRELMNSLFPDSVYSNESGGLPQAIPDLQYTDLLAFHKKYYHPSNSYIYLYGNMDMEEKLIWLDKAYLSRYDKLEIDSKITLQTSFKQRVEVEKKYTIGVQESEENRTFLTYNAVIGTNLDPELNIAFQVLNYVLLGFPGAPLRQALIDRRIAKDAYGVYNNAIYQPTFSVFAKNGNATKESFMAIISEVLQQLVQEGIDKKTLLAGINSLEFKYREADFGSIPKGLHFCLRVLDSWLYDHHFPFVHLETNSIFTALKTKMHNGFFEQLLETYLLKNTHTSIVVLVPEKGLNAKKDAELKIRLQNYRDSLNTDEIQRIVDKTHALKEYQYQSSTLDQRASIPMLSRKDMNSKAPALFQDLKNVDGTTILHHKMFTNGIGYLRILFDLKEVPVELLAYAGILRQVLGALDTEHYDFRQLSNEININSGGIFTDLDTYADTKQASEYKATFEINAKILYDKLDFAFDIIREIILTTKFEDTKRIYEIISEMKSREQSSLISSGNITAISRALSYHSEMAAFRDLVGGITHYQLVERIERNFEEEQVRLVIALKELVHHIFRPENMLVSYTADEQGYTRLEPLVAELKSGLFTHPVGKVKVEFNTSLQNEGFKTTSEVQYAAQTGNFLEKGFTYTGSLRVLQMILSYDYLWNNIRVKGGAYGCMHAFQRNGDSYMGSYRDPNLERTYKVFEQTPSYINAFEATESEMTRYIIGAIKGLDAPMAPSMAGYHSLSLYLSNFTMEDLQKEREEVLMTSVKDIVGLAPLVEAVLEYGSRCTIGNEQKIEEEHSRFNEILPLFQR
ncbi:insulinase family protein [Brevibacillus reuszeri]|uniref:insulinase family protein n=1 Tax=Brevibacillus reuszeri TaxID=54915 RepID=UPI00289A58AE|nr:insulinase family protein [Brevibacillus reuszeri]